MAKLGDLINHGAGFTESRAAAKAFIPGYDAQSLETGTDADSTKQETIQKDFTVPGVAPDLKFSSLKSLSLYATVNSQQQLQINTIPGDLPTDSTGLSQFSPLTAPAGGYLADSDLTILHNTRNASLSPDACVGSEHTKTISGHSPEVNDRNLHFLSTALRNLGLVDAEGELITEHGQHLSGFGNKLDPSTDPQGSEGDIPYDVIQNLISTNRFSPGSSSPFLLHEGNGKSGEARITKGLFSLQTGKFGKYDKSRDGVTVEVLRKAALETLLKAQSVDADEARSVADGIFGSGNPYHSSDSLYLNPHVTQIGYSQIGIDGLRIRSAKVMDKFAGDPGVQATGADDLIKLRSFDQGIFSTGDDDPNTGKAPFMNAKTYGTMNSPSEQFGGVAPFGMVLPAFYGIVVFGILGLGIGALITGITSLGGRAPAKTPESPWSYPLGGNYNGGDEDIGEKFLKLFGLSRDVPMSMTSLASGMMLYYGITHNPFFSVPSAESIVESLINLLIGPGFYVVVGKRIFQDFAQVTQAFANYTNIGEGGFNFFAMFTIILSSIESLMSSFTTKFFLVMSSIGRIVELSTGTPGLHGHGGDIIRLTDQSKQKNLTAENRNKMSRIHAGPNDVKSPLSMHLFDSLWGVPLDGHTLSDGGVQPPMGEVGARQIPTAGKRLTHQEVMWIEEKINAEYVPFSFQDLRTNEVIGLPAFITSLSDDFSANYNSTHGFGRTDPVYSYSKTTRQISLSFVMVAMNEPDHHYLWATVNKLVAMVYPQRDMGVLREDDENKMIFAQPFSQRIAASPVIRIRLGDVLKSNKSYDSMVKIFGGSSVITLNEEGKKATEVVKEKWTDNEKSTILVNQGNQLFGDLANQLFYASMGGVSAWLQPEDIPPPESVLAAAGQDLYLSAGSDLIVMDAIPSRSVKSRYPIKISDLEIDRVGQDLVGLDAAVLEPGDYLSFTVELDDELDAYAFGGTPALRTFRDVNGFPPEIKVPPIPPEMPKIKFHMLASDAREALNFIDPAAAGRKLEEFASLNDIILAFVYGKENYQSGEFDSTVARDLLEERHGELERRLEAAKTHSEHAEQVKTVSDLLDSKNNAVVRSFNSTHGSGLAGVITQIGFDYMDATWGTTTEHGTEKNLRAPKMVRVQLSFSPIHDMPLGLNSAGDQFAPAYPVGKISGPPPGDVGVDFTKNDSMELKLERAKAKARLAASFLPETKNFGKPELPL